MDTRKDRCWRKKGTPPESGSCKGKARLRAGFRFQVLQSSSFRFVDVVQTALFGAKMDGSKFEYSPVVPPIVEGQLPTKAPSGFDLEVSSEYPLYGTGNDIRRSFPSANITRDYHHGRPAFGLYGASCSAYKMQDQR